MTARFVPLVDVIRGGLVESQHVGAMVLLDRSGEVEKSWGDVHATMYPRSAHKLFQAAAVVRLGIELPSELMAIAASSHSGGDVHVAGVQRILSSAGLNELALRNTPGLPIGRAERIAYRAAGGTASALRADCSGKHAAFLAACVHRGWDVETYLDVQHPLQKAVRAEISQAVQTELEFVSVDGCGAPLFSTSLVGLARGYRAAAVAELGTPQRLVAEAMALHPELVGGPDREPTLAMQAIPGITAKDGAEAVLALAHPNGRACAIKIADGSKRPLMPLLRFVLEQWGAAPSDLARLVDVPVLGGGVPVGELRLSNRL